MSAQPTQTPQASSDNAFRERITASIGIGIMLAYGIVAALAAYAAVSGNTSDQSFQQLKDLLTFLSGLVGTVIGYYFGRVGVEKRAEAAESTVQMVQDAMRTAEKQAAKALADSGVANQLRQVAEQGQQLAEDARDKVEQIKQAAEDTLAATETKLEQGKELVSKLSGVVSSARNQYETLKSGMVKVGEGLDEMTGRLGDEEIAAPPPIAPEELDEMISEMDAALQAAQEWER